MTPDSPIQAIEINKVTIKVLSFKKEADYGCATQVNKAEVETLIILNDHLGMVQVFTRYPLSNIFQTVTTQTTRKTVIITRLVFTLTSEIS